jgi:putative hydrolase of the HAD superfamily
VFLAAWQDEYPARMTGDLEESVRRVCGAVGAAADDARVVAMLQVRIGAHTAMFVPRPDAVATLIALRERSLKIGLITNCSSEMPALWDASALAPLADATVFSATEGVRKPAPEIYALATTRLGVAPSSCVYVGDGDSDELAGAARVGMLPVLLRPGDTQPPTGWTGLVIERLAELPALVDSL